MNTKKKNFNSFPILQKNIEKTSYLFDQLDAIESITTADITDADKRSYLRYFFVTIDSLLKLLPQVKNEAYRKQIINKADETEFKHLIRDIENSYTGTYDTIRDKLSAHQQQLPLAETISWWDDIDAISIKILSDDIKAIRAFMSMHSIANGNNLELMPHAKKFTSEKKFTFNAGRFGMAIEGAVSIIPGHEVQEKSTMVSTAIDFIKKNFWLTWAYDDPKSDHHTHLNNIGWFLAIIDFISLLDCIYDDKKEKSLATLWQETNMIGLENLHQITRDSTFESEIRIVRNKVAAHLDGKDELKDCLEIYYRLDLSKLHRYITDFINSFFAACSLDIRNRHMLAHNVELNGVLALANEDSIKPFSESIK